MCGPVVDTMGAGDAVLARLAVALERGSLPRGERHWRALLTDAMHLAASVCRVAGGLPPVDLRTPREDDHGPS